LRVDWSRKCTAKGPNVFEKPGLIRGEGTQTHLPPKKKYEDATTSKKKEALGGQGQPQQLREIGVSFSRKAKALGKGQKGRPIVRKVGAVCA